MTSNTPINNLLKSYQSETCDFDNVEHIVNLSFMYAEQMPDSHVRCVLYTLAKEMEKRLREDRQRKLQNERGRMEDV